MEHAHCSKSSAIVDHTKWLECFLCDPAWVGQGRRRLDCHWLLCLFSFKKLVITFAESTCQGHDEGGGRSLPLWEGGEGPYEEEEDERRGFTLEINVLNYYHIYH